MKDCLILGPASAFHYEEVFPLLRDNVLRLGHKGYLEDIGMVFLNADGTEKRVTAPFFTTLQVRNRERHFTPTKTYNPQDYPRYDNYDAVECKFKNDIPIDYQGKIGVPISFFFYYPELDYEVLEHRGDLKLNGKTVYERLIIRRKAL